VLLAQAAQASGAGTSRSTGAGTLAAGSSSVSNQQAVAPVQPESGGRTFRHPTARPATARPTIVAVGRSGQAAQAVRARFIVGLRLAVQSAQRGQAAEGKASLSLDAVVTSAAPTQDIRSYAWLSIRGRVGASQAMQGPQVGVDLVLGMIVRTGVIEPTPPNYSGDPLPRIFLNA
jgi:hypothetical protein